jgi:hypothetical protein
MFDIDGIYNTRNDRIWTTDRQHVNRETVILQWQKSPQKLLVWLAACLQGVTPLVMFEKATVDHAHYVREVLPVTVKCGNKVFGNEWILQKSVAKPHTFSESQAGCEEHLPQFIDKDHWPSNSPDLNPLG